MLISLSKASLITHALIKRVIQSRGNYSSCFDRAAVTCVA